MLVRRAVVVDESLEPRRTLRGGNRWQSAPSPFVRTTLETALAAMLVVLAACTSAPVQETQTDTGTYPLKRCKHADQRECVAPFFASDKQVERRIPEGFPRRYLELSDKQVREDECKDAGNEYEKCKQRLEQLNVYFDPLGPPAADKIGVALEGGGNKSAPFSLGVLAGIDQKGLWDRIGAIGSVSGGSYAASFYFNRMLDLYSGNPPTPAQVERERRSWFASCIPDAFSSDGRQYFAKLQDASKFACGEGRKPPYVFHKQFAYQRQVWMHPDVLRLANDIPGDIDEPLHADDVGNLLELLGMTTVTVPFQFVARTIFRWPINSSPSRLAYRLGLEREYSYSPRDWEDALTNSAVPVWRESLRYRRETRTLTALAEKVADKAPNWIILSSAPGYIDGWAWAKPSPRDPMRQQFEITPNGFGSGTYGYARAHPKAPFDWFGASPNGLPILDAVLASAAFFDDNQLLVTQQPWRLLGDATLQFGNVDWFSEVQNFNVPDNERTLSNSLVWPFYLTQTEKGPHTPYIHLQDGGNADNAGILALLRRGYRTVVYAHGTTDEKAQFAALCHLKNQLEFDGSYYIVSRDLQKAVDNLPVSRAERHEMVKAAAAKGSFLNYLDQLCTEQIDTSDLAAFDDNERRDVDKRVRAVAKVLCGRIGEYDQWPDVGDYPERTQPDPRYDPCDAYKRRFPWHSLTGVCHHCPGGGLPITFPVRRDLFYQASMTPMRFHVCRGDALRLAKAARAGQKPTVYRPVSTVVAVVPAVAWDEVKSQIDDLPAGWIGQGWNALCSLPDEARKTITMRACQAPDGSALPAGSVQAPPLPCTALAHVLEDRCKRTDANGIHVGPPEFPQDSLVRLTLHIPYTTYAAYFDLGRAQVGRAIDKTLSDLPSDRADDCSILPTPP